MQGKSVKQATRNKKTHFGHGIPHGKTQFGPNLGQLIALVEQKGRLGLLNRCHALILAVVLLLTELLVAGCLFCSFVAATIVIIVSKTRACRSGMDQDKANKHLDENRVRGDVPADRISIERFCSVCRERDIGGTWQPRWRCGVSFLGEKPEPMSVCCNKWQAVCPMSIYTVDVVCEEEKVLLDITNESFLNQSCGETIPGLSSKNGDGGCL